MKSRIHSWLQHQITEHETELVRAEERKSNLFKDLKRLEFHLAERKKLLNGLYETLESLAEESGDLE